MLAVSGSPQAWEAFLNDSGQTGNSSWFRQFLTTRSPQAATPSTTISSWNCDIRCCQNKAVWIPGGCILCNKQLYADHLQPLFHSCPTDEVRRLTNANVFQKFCNSRIEQAQILEPNAFVRKINITALALLASGLRNGVPCDIRLPHTSDDKARWMMGSNNLHLNVEFADGVKWIARIRRLNANAPPPKVRDYMITSEVATLRFLEKTRVPAPKVFDFALEKELGNRVGVGYILMEKLSGTPLNWNTAGQEHKRKVMNQVADIYLELSRYPFDAVGSLDTPGSGHIGPMVTKLTGVDVPRCASWREFSTRYIIHILNLIQQREIYIQRPVDAYLVHRYLLDLIPIAARWTDGWDATSGFYLKHADEKMDHILVDDEYTITGIIDWESAYTAPVAIAFNAPMGLLPVREFYDREDTVAGDDHVFLDILKSGEGRNFTGGLLPGRQLHRFMFCCGFDLERFWDDFETLFKGFRDSMHVDEGLGWAEWKKVALKRYLWYDEDHLFQFE
ncbi:hypothetical protein QBC36DRAFT_250357 [Triangularia setosa]|uniref:Aminoglycoside phosphotransferase domain-containing protein n=1 Tax=Triangularia setosa TaxID=2587417 RepID=A0AAN7A2P6_9PEZI|nr:hypothetical protein QBC36DRAFT_250357 [Podospora setosa]